MSELIPIDRLAETVMEGLEEYADLAAKDMKKAVRRAGREVRQQIQQTAPRKTGDYADSWQCKTTGETAASLSLTVHSKDRYQLAHLLEKGHAKRGGGRVSAQPHIAPAEEAGTRLLEEEIERSLK